MGKIKPIWRVSVVLFILLGIVALIPVSYFKSPFFDYHTLFPLAPITTVLMWVLAYLVYHIGRWDTQRQIKKSQ